MGNKRKSLPYLPTEVSKLLPNYRTNKQVKKNPYLKMCSKRGWRGNKIKKLENLKGMKFEEVVAQRCSEKIWSKKNCIVHSQENTYNGVPLH